MYENRRRPRASSFGATVAVAVTMAIATGSTCVDAATAAPKHAQGPSLGAHTLLAQPDGQGSAPAIAGPVRTQASGSALLVLVGGYNGNAALPSDNYGNTWVQQGPRITYRGYSGRFGTAAYVALPAKGGSDHRVSLAKPGVPAGEISAPFVEIRNAGVLQDVATSYPAPGTVARIGRKLGRNWPGAGLTSGEVTTTGPATLVAVWWGDAYVYRMTAVPDQGFKVIERFLDLPPSSGVQCAVAVRQVDRAGTWRVTWRGAPAQGAILWLFAFQAGS
ncbi:hypothetical protein [Frateuria sp. STR12]|uniref:hypothetical protein n=1 Tax=Frateuria hangzhouensis TaxID=2995589 RepID=UPI002260BA5E|nr:hypothetical protein [Frateuria sp. STR12]MCX7514608.1 hypothetical protein [Frateuria sp. STR12]